MKRIIDYKELPYSSRGQSIYLRMETDPKLYIALLEKGYTIVNHIADTSKDTIYLTGQRQVIGCSTFEEYKEQVDNKIQSTLKKENIVKPETKDFNFKSLFNHEYKLPFVLKNENRNGGKEKFLINTEEDYDNLIAAVKFLLNRKLFSLIGIDREDIKYKIDYNKYLEANFKIQEYIDTPSEYNTTVRLITTPSNDLLYASLKYNEQEQLRDDTTLLGYLLRELYPLSTKSIVSNTLSGGHNLLLGESLYTKEEEKLLRSHNISSDDFASVITASSIAHKECSKELGIICGFDYIFDKLKEKWYLLEYHSRPMVGDYSKRQGLNYNTKEERLRAEGRVRATALQYVLKK